MLPLFSFPLVFFAGFHWDPTRRSLAGFLLSTSKALMVDFFCSLAYYSVVTRLLRKLFHLCAVKRHKSTEGKYLDICCGKQGMVVGN